MSTNKPLFYMTLYRSSTESRAFSSHSTWAFMDATNMLFLVCLCILFEWRILLLSSIPTLYSLVHVCTHGKSLHACAHSWDMSMHSIWMTHIDFKYIPLLSHACVHSWDSRKNTCRVFVNLATVCVTMCSVRLSWFTLWACEEPSDGHDAYIWNPS